MSPVHVDLSKSPEWRSWIEALFPGSMAAWDRIEGERPDFVTVDGWRMRAESRCCWSDRHDPARCNCHYWDGPDYLRVRSASFLSRGDRGWVKWLGGSPRSLDAVPPGSIER